MLIHSTLNLISLLEVFVNIGRINFLHQQRRNLVRFERRNLTIFAGRIIGAAADSKVPDQDTCFIHGCFHARNMSME